ncbi:RING/U-box superfamily protein [Euphorbia peplus]|nr:RING/U-box superfamily protein [Euphorbia peplus]
MEEETSTWRARLRFPGLRLPKSNAAGESSGIDNGHIDINGGAAGNMTVQIEGSPAGDGGPPADDVCPICFGVFTVACRANCNHWFCGSCILQYWNYSAASKPCKCPMCASSITKLTPEASLCSRKEEEVTKVLELVNRYNRLFVGGALGLVQKVRESPLFIKRMFHQMMDPDRPESYLHEMRLCAMMLSVLYAATPFNFIPTGGLGIVRLFDYAAIALVLVLRLVGIYRRRRLTLRVRNLAAAQPLLDE